MAKSSPARTRPPATARHLGSTGRIVAVASGTFEWAEGPEPDATLGARAHPRGALSPRPRGPGGPHADFPGPGLPRLLLLRRRRPLDRRRPWPQRRLRLDLRRGRQPAA